MRVLFICGLLMATSSVVALAQSVRTRAPDGRPIAGAIRNYLHEGSAWGADGRLKTSWADLNGDGRDEAIVYVIDRDRCGSGGCSLYILSGDDKAWRVVGRIGPSQLPIYRLQPGRDRWAELGVTVYGGGLQQHVVAVPHSTQGYATNPTVAPSRPIDPNGAKVLLDAED